MAAESHGRAQWPFLRGVVRAFRTVGAVAPTSRGVARRLAVLADVGSAGCVAELGPGTGAITRALLAALPPDGQVWAFEVYEPFVEHLRTTLRDPRLRIVHHSAEMIGSTGPPAGGPPFDAIVSALPFSLMGPALTERVVRASAGALSADGVLVALQYHPRFLAPFLRAEFAEVGWQLFPWNVPPALLLRARSPRSRA